MDNKDYDALLSEVEQQLEAFNATKIEIKEKLEKLKAHGACIKEYEQFQTDIDKAIQDLENIKLKHAAIFKQ